jgi:hypothetical protein
VSRIGLVGCVKTKLPHPAPARDLYASDLFRGRRAYVENTCERWFILSAKHGLVEPDEVLQPYDQTLKDVSVAERQDWAARVLGALRGRVGEFGGSIFEIHAGVEYVDYGLAEGIRAGGGRVERPAQGLGLLEQQAFYRSPEGAGALHRAPSSRGRRSTAPGTESRKVGEKYAPLREYLASVRGAVELSFDNIEGIVGSLPASARNHRAWWANDATHVQARAWLDAGRRVASVELGRGRVRFERT